MKHCSEIKFSYHGNVLLLEYYVASFPGLPLPLWEEEKKEETLRCYYRGVAKRRSGRGRPGNKAMYNIERYRTHLGNTARLQMFV